MNFPHEWVSIVPYGPTFGHLWAMAQCALFQETPIGVFENWEIALKYLVGTILLVDRQRYGCMWPQNIVPPVREAH